LQLPKVYEPNKYEKDIYALWEKKRTFTPKKATHKDSFTIMMPLPNANGNLHIGHVLFITLQDIVTRYPAHERQANPMVAGADHAGFETWVVYEKMLEKQGKSRFDYSREELYQQVWDFVTGHRQTFENQFRELGASVDWSRFTFSLDDKIIRRVYDTFKKMWDDGLVYRGERLVNYCTKHRTSFADIEVVYKDAKTPLYYMKYGPFVLATTRPETKFGDTAVAVNPKDKRYQKYVGKVIKVEGVNGPFEVMVVADNMVDPKFGTGVVKITPAHDFNDWEVAQRHNLPAVRVINHDGTLNERAGRFRGLKVTEARKQVVTALKEMDLLVKVDEDYQNRVGHCYKCDTVIEPMLMKQWFIDMKPLADMAIQTLRKDEIKFYPSVKKQQLTRYLEGLKDWNISRQIAWGIPIPAFQNINDSDDWIYDERVGEQEITVDGKRYRRDPDVFDTWFSSGQWPYATLSPLDSPDFKQFYPTNLMETGGEILYPWVSRMIMLGLYVTGQVPFTEVYIHGYVLAADGTKMSKSVGNVVDPASIRNKFGTDALRLGLVEGRAPAVNRPYDETKTIAGRNFANKLWNIARYIQDKMDGQNPPAALNPQTIADDWILTKLQHLTERVTADLDNYRFAEAYDKIYHTMWDDLADWYIEASKIKSNLSVLAYGLEIILKLAHPFAPFVTEQIWQSLGWQADNLLASSPWPKPIVGNAKNAKEFEQIISIVSEIRHLAKELNLSKPLLDYGDSPFVEYNADLIKMLSRAGELNPSDEGKGYRLTGTKQPIWLRVDDDKLKQYAQQLRSRQGQQRASIKRLKQRLANKGYTANAPARVIEQTKQQLEQAIGQLVKLETELERFS